MEKKFTFIDLFAGIGGFRIALEKLGGKCLGYSEIDKYALETYQNNFIRSNTDELDLGDITKLARLPKVDVLVGGVPCQSWSVAGKMRGFEDPRGKLWHDSIRLVSLNRPKVFIFENVRGLYDPRNKANLDLIIQNLKSLEYDVHYSLLNSYDFGLPQYRQRIFIVGFDKKQTYRAFQFPKPLLKNKNLLSILDGIIIKEESKRKLAPDVLFGGHIPLSRNKFQMIDELNDFFVLCDTRNGHTTIHSWDILKTSHREKNICLSILQNRRKKIYGKQDGNPLSYESLRILIKDLKKEDLEKLVLKKILKKTSDDKYDFVNSKNSAGINGIYRIYLPNSPTFSTLTATGTRDVVATEMVSGNNPDEFKRNFIEQILKKKKYRQLTTNEARKLQGFPKNFIVHKNEKIAQKQFGNAVSVNTVYYLMESIISTGIFNLLYNEGNGRISKKGDTSKSENLDAGNFNQKPQTEYTQTY